jgi:hypothetical protein
MTSRRRAGTIVRRAVLGAALAVLALVALEGASSMFGLARAVRALQPPPENFRQAAYDTLVGWIGIPNLAIRDNYGPGIRLTTNAEGMRIHRPATTPLAPGEHRVVCSGDSFTFGSGVADDETFCARLEQEIPGIRTLNLAQRGYGNDQMYLRYRRDGVRYPHQLHLFNFIWADLERMTMTSFLGYEKPVVRVRDGRLVAENVPVPEWGGWSRWTDAMALLPRIRLMQLLRERVDLSDSAKMARVDAQVMEPLEAIFRDLARLGKEHGSAVVLVYLPAPPDLVPGPWDARRAKLAALARKTGVRFVDLTDEIRQVPADSVDWLFITVNALPVRGSSGHYTPQGHAWVAKHLAEHLRAMPEVAAALGMTPAALPGRVATASERSAP